MLSGYSAKVFRELFFFQRVRPLLNPALAIIDIHRRRQQPCHWMISAAVVNEFPEDEEEEEEEEEEYTEHS